MKSPTLLSEVAFGSFLVYSPRGRSSQSRRSRTVCYAIKQDQPGFIAQAVKRLRNDFASTGLKDVLGRDVTLVPAPRSTPLVKGALWPAQRIAEELVAAGLGRKVQPVVTRATAVTKSAFAGPGGRPSPQRHLESLAIEPKFPLRGRVAVIDDVITKGATALAVASLIRSAFPSVDPNVFAMVRTMSFQPNVGAVVDPTVGTIMLNFWGDATRDP